MTYFSGLNIPRTSSKKKAAIESVSKSTKDVKGILRPSVVAANEAYILTDSEANEHYEEGEEEVTTESEEEKEESSADDAEVDKKGFSTEAIQ